MNPVQSLRQKWAQNAPTLGLWITLESPSLTEICALLGLDWIVIDMEHGHLGWKEALEHLRAARGSGMAVFIRVPDFQKSPIKRALDLGAHGILLPLIRTPQELREAVAHAKYAPQGHRGIGGERAVSWGLHFQEYLQHANKETLVIPLIETAAAADQIDGVLAVPGVEAIFFGPADLSADRGHLGQWEGPGVAEQIETIRAKAKVQGIAAGVVSLSLDDAEARKNQGFQMIGLGSDAGLVIRSLRQSFARLGVKERNHSWF